MFSFIKYSNSRDENIYDIRFPLNEKTSVLQKDKLQFKHIEKKYYLNNVVITINPNGCFFNYENDISVYTKGDYIVRNYDIIHCPKFSFYETDVEEEYKLYENEDSSIRLKEYENYYTYEISSSNDLKI